MIFENDLVAAFFFRAHNAAAEYGRGIAGNLDVVEYRIADEINTAALPRGIARNFCIV